MDDKRAARWARPGVILVALGVALAVLPLDWIEERTGFEPDGGNGSLEWLLVVVPLLVGAACLLHAWRLARRARDVAT